MLSNKNTFANPSGPSDKAGSKRVVFISGMHRSGTSFLSRALNLAGLELPEPDTRGNEWNAKGRWETPFLSVPSRGLFGPQDFWFNPVVINDCPEVRKAMAESMATCLKGRRSFGWKDPRILITLPYWLEVMPGGVDVELVLSLRNPMEVASSLNKRNQIPLEQGLRLCDRYLSHALRYFKMGLNIHLFNFNHENRDRELTRVCGRLGLNPNPHAWRDWFSKDLVHHRFEPAPAMRSYETLLSLWAGQAECGAPAPSQAPSSHKPKLPVAVLLVNGKSNYKNHFWLEPCLNNLIKNTSPHTDFKVFLWNHDQKNQRLKSWLGGLSGYVEVLERSDFDLSGYQGPGYGGSIQPRFLFEGHHVHRTPLQLLYEYARRYYDLDVVLTLDSDAWPVRQNWDYPLIQSLNEHARIFGVWRSELSDAIKPFVHPSLLGIRSQTIEELGLRFDYKPENTGEDTMSNFTRAINARWGDRALVKLNRSNQFSYHPVFGGVYGGLAYHHHLGSRFSHDKEAVKDVTTKGWRQRGENPVYNMLVMESITDMVFEDEESYMRLLMFGANSAPLMVYDGYLQAEPSMDRCSHLVEIAQANMDEQPQAAYYILWLLAKRFSYHPQFLNLLAHICGKTGNQYEARIWQKLSGALA
jgi:hypothetical protein